MRTLAFIMRIHEGKVIVGARTHDDKENKENGKSHQLNRLPAPSVNKYKRKPIARDEAGDG